MFEAFADRATVNHEIVLVRAPIDIEGRRRICRSKCTPPRGTPSGAFLGGDGGEGRPTLLHFLAAAIRNLVSQGNKKILLNLRDVHYIDSSGLGELVSAFTNMRSQGVELKLLNLTEKVHGLLQITKLYTVFDITDDEATSVKSFSPAILLSPLPQPIMR